MSDMGEYWRDMREFDKERKAKNLAAADPTGWTKHSQYHWSRQLNGKRLDYWPSRNKFQYDGGRVMVGDVLGFIRNREKEAAKKC